MYNNSSKNAKHRLYTIGIIACNSNESKSISRIYFSDDIPRTTTNIQKKKKNSSEIQLFFKQAGFYMLQKKRFILHSSIFSFFTFYFIFIIILRGMRTIIFCPFGSFFLWRFQIYIYVYMYTIYIIYVYFRTNNGEKMCKKSGIYSTDQAI